MYQGTMILETPSKIEGQDKGWLVGWSNGFPWIAYEEETIEDMKKALRSRTK